MCVHEATTTRSRLYTIMKLLVGDCVFLFFLTGATQLVCGQQSMLYNLFYLFNTFYL